MDELRRQHYLKAMGVTLWRRRGGLAPAVEPSESEPEPQAPPATIALPAAPSMAPGRGNTGPADASGTPAGTDLPGGGSRRELDGLDWPALRDRVRDCRACALRAGCTQTVFGVGNTQADLLVIGEAPGADEDRQGEPFVGRAGQLLNAMLLAMGFPREQVFIANIVKCRPPNNRDPLPEEALRCEPYLLQQIELIRPRLILAVGRVAAQNLLKTDITVGKLRGRFHAFGERRIPLVVTYHPAYLLRSPDQKGRAWQDLQLALAGLRGEGL